MLTIEPKTHEELYDEPRFLEFALPGESDLADDAGGLEDVRQRIDDQIIAALVTP